MPKEVNAFLSCTEIDCVNRTREHNDFMNQISSVHEKMKRSICVSATSLYVYIDPLITCRVSAFRLPDTVLGVVSDYVISLLVAIQLL